VVKQSKENNRSNSALAESRKKRGDRPSGREIEGNGSRHVRGSKNSPLQRIRVSPSSSLSTIFSYIQRLAGPESGELDITLDTPYLTKTVQLPLIMTVAELLLVTHRAEARH
jgi:hypothetical protein